MKNINKSFDFVEAKHKVNDFLRSLRRNAHINRLFLNSNDFVDENLKNLENVEFLKINEPRVMKKKGRSKGSINKKGLITRAQRKVVNSTRRDSFGFEHVEISIQVARDGERERNREREKTTSAKEKRKGTTLTKEARKKQKSTGASLT